MLWRRCRCSAEGGAVAPQELNLCRPHLPCESLQSALEVALLHGPAAVSVNLLRILRLTGEGEEALGGVEIHAHSTTTCGATGQAAFSKTFGHGTVPTTYAIVYFTSAWQLREALDGFEADSAIITLGKHLRCFTRKLQLTTRRLPRYLILILLLLLLLLLMLLTPHYPVLLLLLPHYLHNDFLLVLLLIIQRPCLCLHLRLRLHLADGLRSPALSSSLERHAAPLPLRELLKAGPCC
mmetsp:Transcript_28257/g.59850  ORF Transcript_28257/g.59850 Transcript_28257/m.59850 type:complete len:238 (+) Transcript_28257:44-757(+)